MFLVEIFRDSSLFCVWTAVIVNLALSVGIFPYVLKLLQSPIDEYKHVLLAIWAQIMSFDESCQVDVVKDRAISHFIRHLNSDLPTKTGPAIKSTTIARSEKDDFEQRTMAAYILSVICHNYTRGQSESINEKLHLVCGSLLQSIESEYKNERGCDLTPAFRTWICICLGHLAKTNGAAQSEVISTGVHQRLLSRLDDETPDVRAACCYALGFIIGSAPIQPLSSFTDHQASPPQELSPSTQSMTGSVLVPSFSNASQPTFGGLGLQPYPLASSSQTGMNYLVPNEQSTLFGTSLTGPVPTQPEIRTVFDDHHRMLADTHIATELSIALDDASPIVRFEALIALNHFVVKYVDGIVSVAGEKLGSSQRTIMAGTPSIPVPSGMTSDIEKTFTEIWARLLSHYRREPQPSVRKLVTSIVVSVNERVMSVQSKLRQQRKTNRRQSLFSPATEEGDETAILGSESLGRRNASGMNVTYYTYDSPQNSIKRSGSIGLSIGTPPQGLRDHTIGAAKRHSTTTSLKFDLSVEELPCATSMFYSWKRVQFSDRSVNRSSEHLDLLSDMGAIQHYRSKRNAVVQQKGQLLKDSFALLAQPPTQTSNPPFANANDVPSAADIDIEMRKETTHLKQLSVLSSPSRGSASILRFHPYEPALVACGGTDITCWNVMTSERMVSFSNENPKHTRISAGTWINETSTSLFLTGCNDGSVRIWDGLLEPNDEISREKPTLISSFFAAPNISFEKGSTGLVLEYQSYSGQLIAGGSTKQVHCWDLEAEKCANSFDTCSDDMLTTLESAWKHSYDGYFGLSADIVIAGFSNGALKLFDVRVKNGAPALNIPGKRRIKQSEFDEHNSWIVDVSFTGFAGRHEVSNMDLRNNVDGPMRTHTL